MKKYRLLLILVFIIFAISAVAISSSFLDYYSNKYSLKYLTHIQILRTEDFEKNSILLSMPNDLDENSKYALLEELSMNLGDSLVGYTQMDNVVSGTQGFRIVSNYLLDEKYIKLVAGRMPDINKTTSTYCEVLGLADVHSINDKFKLELKFEEETLVINLEIVGTYYNQSFPYPTTYEIFPTTVVIIPEIQQNLGKALINPPNNVYFTFKNEIEKTAAEKYINHNTRYGSIAYFTSTKVINDNNYQFYKAEAKKTLIMAILLSIVIAFFLVIAQSVLLNIIKTKTKINLFWIIFVMILGAILPSLIISRFGAFFMLKSFIPFNIGLMISTVCVFIVLIIYIERKRKA